MTNFGIKFEEAALPLARLTKLNLSISKTITP